MKRIHIYLTEEQIKALDTEAARTGLKRSEIVRRWIDAATENIFGTGVDMGLYRQCSDYAATVVIPKDFPPEPLSPIVWRFNEADGTYRPERYVHVYDRGR